MPHKEKEDFTQETFVPVFTPVLCLTITSISSVDDPYLVVVSTKVHVRRFWPLRPWI